MNGDFYVGGIIKFGRYKGEDITWRILAQNGNKYLLISEKGLETCPYNREIKNVTWEECTLRYWLNSDFMSTAFSIEQQQYIIQNEAVTNVNSLYYANQGSSIQDKIFLLSVDEVNQYFKDNKDRRCVPAASVSMAVKSIGYRSCWWWLRSPGGVGHHAAEVKSDGSVYYFGRNVCRVSCVRPALWIMHNA